MSKIKFIDERGSFELNNPNHTSGLYLPLASLSGLKSAVTPDLNGDAKTDQNHFLIAPKSIMNLNTDRDSRNFFLCFQDELWSVTGASAAQEANKFTDAEDENKITVGRMWQTIERIHPIRKVKASTTIFSLLNTNSEIMTVNIVNDGSDCVNFAPVGAIPIFGRSADNLRDHRHVTSLLNRALITEYGVVMHPTLSFDERGHQINDTTYYVLSCDEKGNSPSSFIANADDYLGEGGTYLRPRSLLDGNGKSNIWKKPGAKEAGCEVVGVMRYEKNTLAPGESISFQIAIGMVDVNHLGEMDDVRELIKNKEILMENFKEVKKYWESTTSIHFKTNNEIFDKYMEWIGFQPELRRIFGCSFLPHHDYGRGGRGWRDLWQDCLALLLTNPEDVRQLLLDNFKGVRMDGTNATIIGTKPGEFKEDRNGIARVWMDHGFWPFLTIKLYMDQTGDLEILNEKVNYFRDVRTSKGNEYVGTVLEHLLIENLTAFYDVGDHNEIKLKNADWNDALDMAADKGESVAFTCAYAGNLKELATYMRIYKAKTGLTQISLLKELLPLLEEDSQTVFDSPEKKNDILKAYINSVYPSVSGEMTSVDIERLAVMLERKAEFMMKNIRGQEWVTDGQGNGWFNGYYDNNGQMVEGIFGKDVRMMLTGQVFSIMSGTAKKESVESIVKACDKYLYEKAIGGYRLNTDFKELRTDLGRMFGFSYGDKENGAVFSHMAVMYANALYKRGFAQEGFKSLNSLFEASADFDRSHIYPGIPEYFNNKGRGLYSYLTGAGSWYLLTMVTEAFGVRGNAGDLHIEPKLLKEQFNSDKEARIILPFKGHKFEIIYRNKKLKNYGEYRLGPVLIDDTCIVAPQRNLVIIPEKWINEWNEKSHVIEVELI